MTDMRGLANVNAQNVGADGAWLAERLLRDGTGVGCDWRTALAMQGRVFSANFGQGYTPLTFTTFAAATPMAAIRVPAGIVIFPLAVMVGLDVSTGTKNNMLVRQCSNDIGNGTSAAATAGPTNLRTDAPFASACTCRQLYTVAGTAETSPIEIFRDSASQAEAAGSDGRNLVWSPMMETQPVLVGPATFMVYVFATTTQGQGYIEIDWAELPANYVQ